jgi:hypothetical protein
MPVRGKPRHPACLAPERHEDCFSMKPSRGRRLTRRPPRCPSSPSGTQPRPLAWRARVGGLPTHSVIRRRRRGPRWASSRRGQRRESPAGRRQANLFGRPRKLAGTHDGAPLRSEDGGSFGLGRPPAPPGAARDVSRGIPRAGNEDAGRKACGVAGLRQCAGPGAPTGQCQTGWLAWNRGRAMVPAQGTSRAAPTHRAIGFARASGSSCRATRPLPPGAWRRRLPPAGALLFGAHPTLDHSPTQRNHASAGNGRGWVGADL